MATAKKSAAKKPAATARAAKTDATVLLQRAHSDVKKLFKQYEKLAGIDLAGLAEQMAERKSELMAEVPA